MLECIITLDLRIGSFLGWDQVKIDRQIGASISPVPREFTFYRQIQTN